MMGRVQIGLVAGDPADVVAEARRAEEAGFDLLGQVVDGAGLVDAPAMGRDRPGVPVRAGTDGGEAGDAVDALLFGGHAKASTVASAGGQT